MKKIRRIIGIVMVMMLSMSTLTAHASELQPAPTLDQAIALMSERGQYPVYDAAQGIAICYAPVLIGEKDANALVGNIVVTDDAYGKRLTAAVLLIQQDTLYPGMNTFTAVFYDINGQLIKAVPTFNRDKPSYVVMMLEWFIPEGTASVVIY